MSFWKKIGSLIFPGIEDIGTSVPSANEALEQETEVEIIGSVLNPLMTDRNTSKIGESHKTNKTPSTDLGHYQKSIPEPLRTSLSVSLIREE